MGVWYNIRSICIMERICIIGSGNWGSAIARIVGRNVKKYPGIFQPTVTMWVYEETVDGRLLTDWINTSHVNKKYLPGIALPDNVRACPDLVTSVKDSSLLVFVLPHQFVKRTCDTIKGHLLPNARGISLIKGVDNGMGGGLVLVSAYIQETLSLDMSVLMGANIANEVAQDMFCEATIGYSKEEDASIFQKLFDTPTFRISCVKDVAGVELCGALKNIVAIAAGIVDGLDLGENTKAAVIRIGLVEMMKFTELFAPPKCSSTRSTIFFESCGIADLITTCFGGRNRKLAEAHVRTGKSFEVLEQEMLEGQKLQGTLTAKEIYQILMTEKESIIHFPLFVSVYKICYEGMEVAKLLENLSDWSSLHHQNYQ